MNAHQLVMSVAQATREAAGLTPEQAARRAGITREYLRRIERRGGGAPYALACRLARVYGCGIGVFLKTKTTKGGPTEPQDTPGGRAPHRRGRHDLPGTLAPTTSFDMGEGRDV